MRNRSLRGWRPVDLILRPVDELRLRPALLVLGLLTLALPGASLAALTWLSPVSLSSAGQVEPPQVAVNASGDAVAIWSAADGSIQAAVRPAGGAWSSPEQVAAPGQSGQNADVGIDSAGTATAIWKRSNGTNTVISSKTRPAGGAWSPVARQLSIAARDATNPKLAVNAAGGAVAVWQLLEASGTQTIQASTRPPGGSFDVTPADLSDLGEDARFPQVALDASGTAVVVWERHDGTVETVRAANRPPGGAWSAAASVSDPQQANAVDAEVALDGSGNAVAVWDAVTGSTRRVQAASRPAGGPWSTAEYLSTTRTFSAGVAIDPRGTAIAVFADELGLKGATRAAGGGWGPVEPIDTGGQAIAPRVAVDPAGNAVALWRRNGPGVLAARRTAAGQWSAAEDVAKGGTSFLFDTEVALDADGNGVAVWQGSAAADLIAKSAGLDAAGPLLRDLVIPVAGTAGVPQSYSVSPFDVWSALALEPIWQFGDGMIAVGKNVTQAFGAGGTYEVTVSQADVFGNISSGSRTVSIAPPPAPPPPAPAPPPPPAVRDTKGPALSAAALARANRSIRVSRNGRFSLFCGRYAEPVSGSCGGQSLRPASVGAKPPRRVLRVPMRSFRAPVGRRVRVGFRLSRANLLRLKRTRKVKMRGTVVARDRIGNRTTVRFVFTLLAPKWAKPRV